MATGLLNFNFEDDKIRGINVCAVPAFEDVELI